MWGAHPTSNLAPPFVVKECGLFLLLEARGIEVSQSTIVRTLQRKGFVRKKVLIFRTKALRHAHVVTEVSAPAIERNEERRALYQIRIAENYEPEQLVFVDEAGCNRITTKRSYAWAPLGWRARRRDYFIRGQK